MVKAACLGELLRVCHRTIGPVLNRVEKHAVGGRGQVAVRKVLFYEFAGTDDRGVYDGRPVEPGDVVRHVEVPIVALPGGIRAHNSKPLCRLYNNIHKGSGLSASEVLDKQIGGIVKILALQGTGSLGLLGLALL